jgi:hypothetical protein
MLIGGRAASKRNANWYNASCSGVLHQSSSSWCSSSASVTKSELGSELELDPDSEIDTQEELKAGELEVDFSSGRSVIANVHPTDKSTSSTQTSFNRLTCGDWIPLCRASSNLNLPS